MNQLVTLQGEPVAIDIYTPVVHKGDAILVHGFTGSKEDFQLIGPLLADRGYRVIVMDNRGQHESPHSVREDAYTLDSLARDVVELAALMQLKMPHLLGHSLGGLVAQRAVAQSPHTWKSLTLMCTGPHAFRDTTWLDEVLRDMPSMTMQESWERYQAAGHAGHQWFEILKKRWFASDPRSIITHAYELTSAGSVMNELKASKVPVHVFYGENDDAWPLEMQNQMAKDLSAQLDVIKDAGHCPNEDQPEATATVIADFWDLI